MLYIEISFSLNPGLSFWKENSNSYKEDIFWNKNLKLQIKYR